MEMKRVLCEAATGDFTYFKNINSTNIRKAVRPANSIISSRGSPQSLRVALHASHAAPSIVSVCTAQTLLNSFLLHLSPNTSFAAMPYLYPSLPEGRVSTEWETSVPENFSSSCKTYRK
jgi:hypothetical protein